MKPSHYTTPRTLAECTFTVGYASASSERRANIRDAVLAIAVFAAIGVLLAWRG